MQKKWLKGMAAVMAAAALAGAFAGCGGDKKAASGSADAGKTPLIPALVRLTASL